MGCFILKKIDIYDIIRTFSRRHWSSVFIARIRGIFYLTKKDIYANTELFTRTDNCRRIRR